MHRPRRRIGTRALASALWLASAPLAAQAQEPTPGVAQPTATAAQRETARNLMDEGERMRAAGDLRGALARFSAAHAILHIPTTGLQLARVHAGLGELVEARGLALEAANHPASPGEPPVFAGARREASALAAELATKVPSMQVQVSPAGASYSLSIDGTLVPEASRALPFRTNPGLHDVLIEASGFVATRKQVRLDEGQAQLLAYSLTPAPQAESVPQPSAALAVSPRAAAQTVRVADPGLVDGGSAQRTRAYIGLGAGGAVFLTGVITGIVSASKTSGIKDRCEGAKQCPQEKSAVSSANTFANVANVTIPLGLVGIGYGLYEFLTLPATTDSSRARLQLRWEGTSATLRGTL